MKCKALFISVAISLVASQAAAGGNVPLGQGLFATFTNSKTAVSFVVCGSIGGGDGCYGFATLSSHFDYACGVLQGEPRMKGDVMTRDIYVLDKRSTPNADIMLYVYERKDVISNEDDSVSATLKKTIDLGIKGGHDSHCMLAGNRAFVYAATDASNAVAIVGKSDFSIDDYGGSTPHSITADGRGYVAMNFTWGFVVVDPDGNFEEDGGGSPGFINQRNGWIQN